VLASIASVCPANTQNAHIEPYRLRASGYLVRCHSQLIEHVHSVLHLHSAAARLPQLGLTSDPYAVLSVGASAATSTVVRNKRSPQWEEQKFVLFVTDLATDTLKV
jgi:hypothetical protein